MSRHPVVRRVPSIPARANGSAARVITAFPANLRVQVGADAGTRAEIMAPLLDTGLPPELASRAADNAMRQRAQEARSQEVRAQDNADQRGAADTGSINEPM
ncbi:MAG: hypothetical protein WCF16_06245 [Alphaproteobacteria bacterium]